MEGPSEEERRNVVRYRMKRARETLGEAQVMLEEEYGHAFVNRLYYACFYAVEALLATEHLSAKTHKGARILFNKHFVKTQRFPSDYAGFYNDLFEERIESDYDTFVNVEVEEIRSWLPRAEAFVEAIARRIEEEP